ncbi:TRAP dicarboxylate transporter subunit DctP [Kosmotoga arenicorallina S304]|uniref:TRAP dicarboxylate transporter subunit DctP n=1 Tax=Kosmotoga arenicorallina S304 TaxID=1453497 RepID=A0A182C7Y0_9BACT|nr:sialic acid TRAP transporter substrate-binding protein SiaP [Kosmotoga arenicorallina]OAA31508.1 TRAP dicarboxylate transporter subunit DctP [Kosmotoga arenicorallina S304]
MLRISKLVLFTVVIILLGIVIVAEDPTYVLRFNTVAAPTQPQVLAMHKFADVVKELSGGKIIVQVFHSGQLGDQKTSLLAVMRGDLEMAGDGAPSWFADLGNMPELGVFGAAYVFRDLDHMYSVLLGPIGQEYFDKLAQKSGLRVLDVWYLGTRELNLTAKAGPVRKPEDLKGIKLRMPNNETFLDMGRALGAMPTPMGFGEVYLGLKTGTIDGQDNPLPTDLAAKFVEVTKYIVLTDHSIGIICPVINEKLWQSMPEKYRVYINQAMKVARYYMNSIVLEQEAELLGKFVEEYNMEIIIPDKDAFMKHAVEYYSQPKFDEKWGEGMYKKIQMYPYTE